MPNLSALSAITTTATSLSNLILVSPQKTLGYQPLNAPNADGTPSTTKQQPALLFHYEGEQTLALESDITDHYVEDNTAVQDQIALKPIIVTTHGFIGDLNDVPPNDVLKYLKIAADKLTTVTAFVPGLSATALIAYSIAFQLYQTASNVIDNAVSSWDSLAGNGGESVIDGIDITLQSNQNKQQVMFQQFFGYYSSRTLFTVQTPWAVIQNMAILRLRAIQDAETEVISDFEVTFKQIRKASTYSFTPPTLQTRGATQASSLSNNGTSTPTSSIGLDTGIAQMGVA